MDGGINVTDGEGQQDAFQDELAAYENPLLAILVPDPVNPPDLIVLTGFLGNSPNAGHKRLYVDADLRVWHDIPSMLIVHIEKLGGNGGRLPEDMVGVDRFRATATGHPLKFP